MVDYLKGLYALSIKIHNEAEDMRWDAFVMSIKKYCYSCMYKAAVCQFVVCVQQKKPLGKIMCVV